MRFGTQLFAFALVSVLSFASCGGGDGSDNSQSAVTFAMTDAASDDVESFIVDVTAVDLTTAGGGVVGILSAPVTVDLASLDDTSEIMNVLNVPPGFYKSATITLDFTNAICLLVGQTTPASIVDVDGNALTGTLTLPIQFGKHPFEAIGGRHHLLEFDFDLDQSVSTDQGTNTATVEPSFALHFDPSKPKQLLAFGGLVSVDTAHSSFVADLKTKSGASLDDLTIVTSSKTVFQIDGVASVGAAGLAALAAKPVDTWVQVYGKHAASEPKMIGQYVEAGTGTYNGGTDIVEGHIVDITSGGAGADPQLTVLGRSNDASHTTFQYNTQFTVATSFANTKVVRKLSSTQYTTDALDVGQRVRIFGMLTGVTMDATAATDVVREQPTKVFGFANLAPASGELELDLKRVDLRDQSLFAWADGGTSPADPAHFKVDIGTLGAGLGITNGTAVEARGYFSAIDDNGDDVVASSLENLDNAPSLLLIHDKLGGFTVTTTALPASIEFDITGVAALGEKAIIDQGFVGANSLPTSPAPTVVPRFALGLYTIHDKTSGSISVFLKFSDFSNALALQISQAAFLGHFSALGKYDANTNQMQATIATAVIH